MLSNVINLVFMRFLWIFWDHKWQANTANMNTLRVTWQQVTLITSICNDVIYISHRIPHQDNKLQHQVGRPTFLQKHLVTCVWTSDKRPLCNALGHSPQTAIAVSNAKQPLIHALWQKISLNCDSACRRLFFNINDSEWLLILVLCYRNT
jgi:hypothetical protein